MKSQATLTQGAFSLVFEQVVPEKTARIMLYVGKVYVTSFDITIDQLRSILICMDSKQKRYIDQKRIDKDWFAAHGWHIQPY